MLVLIPLLHIPPVKIPKTINKINLPKPKLIVKEKKIFIKGRTKI